MYKIFKEEKEITTGIQELLGQSIMVNQLMAE